MKNKILSIGLGLGLLAATAMPAAASAYFQSFNITNAITPAQVWGFPTNSVGTNGIYPNTGTPVVLQDFDHIGFNFQGMMICATSTPTYTLTFELVFSQANNPPLVITPSATNISIGPYATWLTNSTTTNSVFTQNDWTCNIGGPASGVGTNFAVYLLSFTVQAGTNWLNLQTNLNLNTPALAPIADAQWVGIYAITNNMVAGGFVTNSVAGITRKKLGRNWLPQ